MKLWLVLIAIAIGNTGHVLAAVAGFCLAIASHCFIRSFCLVKRWGFLSITYRRATYFARFQTYFLRLGNGQLC